MYLHPIPRCNARQSFDIRRTVGRRWESGRARRFTSLGEELLYPAGRIGHKHPGLLGRLEVLDDSCRDVEEGAWRALEGLLADVVAQAPLEYVNTLGTGVRV